MKFSSVAMVLMTVGMMACGADPCSKSSPCRNDTQATLAQREQCRANNSAFASSPCFSEAIAALNCESDNVICGGDGRTDRDLTSIRVQNSCRSQLAELLACCTRNSTSAVCGSAEMMPPSMPNMPGTQDGGTSGTDASTSTPDSATRADTGTNRDAGGSSMGDATPDARPRTVGAGGACTESAMCGALTCDTSVSGGMCTQPCHNDSMQVNEQIRCSGVGSTCLAIGDGADAEAHCTNVCNPASASSCRSGFVCTGFWYTHAGGVPDSAGCYPFCSNDSHCAAGTVCNARTGSCVPSAPAPTLLADGMPCTIPAAGAASPCRGICFRMSDTSSTGICGSFINRATQSACPDEPSVIEPLGRAGQDNLGLCLFRTCSASRCCPNGLVCEGDGAGATEGFCGIDDPTVPNIACAR